MTDKEKELQAEAIDYLSKRIAELEMTVGTLRNFSNEQATCMERLKKENAELKANKPKWHKVADGDLPKDENDVLIYSGEDWRMCVGRYSPKYKVWEAGCDTIAWCEIPQFKDKE